MTDEKNEKEELLKYFVYVLVDPLNYKIFYVGRGQNMRPDQHKAGEEKQKEKKIKEIEERGEKVIRHPIGRYETLIEAKSVETTLIKWAYGKENLTNEIHGSGHSLIRSHSHLSERNFHDISGIDKERNLYVHSGEYTKKYKKQISDNQILIKLSDLKEDLNDNFSKLNVSEPKILTIQDPCLLISGFSEVLQIQIRMPPNTGKYFTINYLPKSSKFKNAFEKLILKKFPDQKVRNGNAYGKYFPYNLNNKAVRIYLDNKKKLLT